jgi:hypothetical protein
MTTLEDLYPNGAGYHSAHEPYAWAVVKTLENAGLVVDSWSAEPNDPRAIHIGFRVAAFHDPEHASVWLNDEVNVAWSEDRGWSVVTVADSSKSDGRFVYDLLIARVASPETVVNAVAEQVGERVIVPGDAFPDADFPEHAFEDDDPAFELALARYRGTTS